MWQIHTFFARTCSLWSDRYEPSINADAEILQQSTVFSELIRQSFISYFCKLAKYKKLVEFRKK